MIDLHSHLLPAVDDGSRSVAQSVKVMKAMAAARRDRRVPHAAPQGRRAGRRRRPHKHDEAFAALQARGAAAAPAAPRRGGDAGPAAAGRRRRRPALHPRRHPLHPGRVPPDGGARHGHHRAQPGAGSRPGAAAGPPERYACCSPDAVRPVARAGRVHAGGRHDAALRPVAGAAGAGAGRAPGLADILAADNHGDERSIATGRQFLEAQDGSGAGRAAHRHQPAEPSCATEPLKPVAPVEIRRTWMQRIRQLLDGSE